jgi:Flp pilus assembly protein TadG
LWSVDAAEERGSVLILGLAGVVLVVAVLLVAVDVAALSSARRGAELTADAAARSAVQAIDLDRYYQSRGSAAGGARLPVDPVAARSLAARMVPSPWRLAWVRVTGDVVTVRVTTDVPLQVAGWLGRPRVVVTGEGSASLREFH